jgi:transcriptional regulator with XRE-family HTH domain
MARRILDPARVLRDVGRRVAELRRERELTQEQLAKKAEISWKYLQQIESGSENLTLRSMVNLANLLEVGLADLMQRPSTIRVRPGRPPRESFPVIPARGRSRGRKR